MRKMSLLANLSPLEFSLLDFFVKHPGEEYSHKDLAEIFGKTESGIYKAIRHLRAGGHIFEKSAKGKRKLYFMHPVVAQVIEEALERLKEVEQAVEFARRCEEESYQIEIEERWVKTNPNLSETEKKERLREIDHKKQDLKTQIISFSKKAGEEMGTEEKNVEF